MLNLQTVIQGKTYRCNLDKGLDISIDFVNESEGPNCFHAPTFKVSPLKAGDFVGAIEHGSPVNFYNVEINPHGNGTHTECVGHISKEKVFISNVCPTGLLKAQLITIKPENIGNDLVINTNDIPDLNGEIEALLIRTLPNEIIKTTQNYSGTNPAYFNPEAISKIVDAGVKHLIVDLPSIDKEEDGGAMASHKTFWNYDNCLDTEKTITEMVFIPDDVLDGLYLCSINAVSFRLDAAPSRVLLYPLILDDE